MVITVVEGKVMLNKALYIPLIMALLGLQASLQTVRGEESTEPQEASNSAVFTTVMGTQIPSDLSSGMDKTPQTSCGWYNMTGSTNGGGIVSQRLTNGYFTNHPVCSSLHLDTPHHVNAMLVDGVVQVRSWTPSGRQAGPIWFSCMISICFY
jgi:hypothetical protein